MTDETNTDLQRTETDRGRAPTKRTRRAAVERDLGLTQYVSAREVQDSLGCSRAHAYVHLRSAIGRTTGRGMLRAPREVWEAYARRIFGAS